MSSDALTTRERILQSTWTALLDGSTPRVRMSDIANSAGISRQALYLHFANRTELLSIKIIHKVNTHSMETCGFKLLLKLLGAVIPHLGGEVLDIVDEVSNIKLLPTSTCNSIFLDISKLMRHLHISRQYVPPTTLPNRYFNLMMKVLAPRIHVAPNYKDFSSHIKST